MLDAMMCLSLTDSAARLSGTEALPARGPSAWWNVRRVSGRLTLRPRQRHTVAPAAASERSPPAPRGHQCPRLQEEEEEEEEEGDEGGERGGSVVPVRPPAEASGCAALGAPSGPQDAPGAPRQ
ncbi:unnamed protein product [Prorocentrum cordatum]|uniref:Uncharacterized protein n=1 Tax=Prorocentrum cordatum TaxID=2364126 RepID=A0ABN9QAT7_9DINO|nr:unnamed protein product [Polarella glacialis]